MKPLSVADQVGGFEISLIGKQQIVHFPESALLAGGQGRLMGQLRLRMHGKRHVFEDQPHLAGMVLDGGIKKRIGFGAERALIVEKFDDRYRRGGVGDERFTPIPGCGRNRCIGPGCGTHRGSPRFRLPRIQQTEIAGKKQADHEIKGPDHREG